MEVKNTNEIAMEIQRNGDIWKELTWGEGIILHVI